MNSAPPKLLLGEAGDAIVCIFFESDDPRDIFRLLSVLVDEVRLREISSAILKMQSG